MISVLITAKNEPYLQQTIDDLFKNAETDIEVLVGLDGWKPNELHAPHLDKFMVLHEPESIGQRAMLNRLAECSTAKYILKVDAHCSFPKGFDRILLDDMEENYIMAPYLMPLDAEKWTPRMSPRHSMYYFDSNLVMQHGENNEEELVHTMCLQGSFFLMTRHNYFKWNVCEEALGSWGMQGTELGIKAFLNGGKCITNKKTYYAHLFREKAEDFPYERDMQAIRRTKDLFIQKYKTKKIAKLIKQFNYPGDWTKELVNELP
jgi:glycosyltransferase involved in cell wall biosynthesis